MENAEETKTYGRNLIARCGIGCSVTVALIAMFFKEFVTVFFVFLIVFLCFYFLSIPFYLNSQMGKPGALLGLLILCMLGYAAICDYERPIEDRADAYITSEGKCFHRLKSCPAISGHKITPLFHNNRCDEYRLDKRKFSMDIVRKRNLSYCSICN